MYGARGGGGVRDRTEFGPARSGVHLRELRVQPGTGTPDRLLLLKRKNGLSRQPLGEMARDKEPTPIDDGIARVQLRRLRQSEAPGQVPEALVVLRRNALERRLLEPSVHARGGRIRKQRSASMGGSDGAERE